jgi:hypothetical protein
MTNAAIPVSGQATGGIASVGPGTLSFYYGKSLGYLVGVAQFGPPPGYPITGYAQLNLYYEQVALEGNLAAVNINTQFNPPNLDGFPNVVGDGYAWTNQIAFFPSPVETPGDETGHGFLYYGN